MKTVYIGEIFPEAREQLLNNHLQGKGCKICGNYSRNEKNKIDKINNEIITILNQMMD